ncbi:hypothetical protein H6P81_012579 [Aristolochia fimbriata]|uniref:Bifunctional inhibitor/plant lipid transfer protein/seed storage helical domain-containing protein n=1 Tax=Aristolochia fimbriata TaxID=158543 RepID=A0AAV7EDI5_ARIFI|nr:hypothetical protein H6P81_012579 [Aristolochia fimbriata]
MERRGAMVVGVLMMVFAAVAVIGKAEICNLTEEDLMACKPSVSGTNPVDPPAPECCSALQKADFPCLCGYKNSFLLPSMGIDPTLALQLPERCKITPAPRCS